MRIHFDGDLLIYRAGFAAEKMRYKVFSPDGDYLETYDSAKEADAYIRQFEENEQFGVYREGVRDVEPVANALHNAKSILRTTCQQLQSDDLIVYLSGPTNFRDGVATLKPYKGNRDPDHKPVHGPAIKEFLHKNYDVVVSEDEEADDVVAYSHYRMWQEDELSTILCSTDKDLNMVPGLHYNFVKEERYYVTPEEGLRWFYTQLLMGDSTDNIPGIPRVGKVKAERALEDVPDDDGGLAMYAKVLSFYEDAYRDDPMAALMENAHLLWMRREPNEWWSPPKEEV